MIQQNWKILNDSKISSIWPNFKKLIIFGGFTKIENFRNSFIIDNFKEILKEFRLILKMNILETNKR